MFWRQSFRCACSTAQAKAWALGLLAMAATASCTADPPQRASGVSTARLGNHLATLEGAVSRADTLAAARRAVYAAGQLRAAGLQPALYGSFYLYFAPSPAGEADPLRPARGHLLGYVAGRNPNVSTELVLVTASLEGTAAASAIEGMRAVAETAARQTVPEATVGLLLWAPLRGAAQGVRDYLQQPTWSTEAIVQVLIVGADTHDVAAQRALWAARGIPSEVINPPSIKDTPGAGRGAALRVAGAFRLAEAVYLRSMAAAERSAVSDTVLVRHH